MSTRRYRNRLAVSGQRDDDDPLRLKPPTDDEKENLAEHVEKCWRRWYQFDVVMREQTVAIDRLSTVVDSLAAAHRAQNAIVEDRFKWIWSVSWGALGLAVGLGILKIADILKVVLPG